MAEPSLHYLQPGAGSLLVSQPIIAEAQPLMLFRQLQEDSSR